MKLIKWNYRQRKKPIRYGFKNGEALNDKIRSLQWLILDY
jgi:hypothetical protein